MPWNFQAGWKTNLISRNKVRIHLNIQTSNQAFQERKKDNRLEKIQKIKTPEAYQLWSNPLITKAIQFRNFDQSEKFGSNNWRLNNYTSIMEDEGEG